MCTLPSRLRHFASRLFFAYFLRVLLAFVALAEWGCVWWVLSVIGGLPLPLWGCLIGPVGFFLLNRMLVATRHGGMRLGGSMLRVYTAAAFIAVFCFTFMMGAAALWGAVRLTVGMLTAEVLAVAPGANSGAAVDNTFRWLTSLGMAGIAMFLSYGYVFGQRRLRVTRTSVALPGAAQNGSALRIVHITDLHVGRNLRLEELRRFVAIVNELKPDLLCLTGDIADSPLANLDAFFPILGEFRARHGVYAVLGNHDHYTGRHRVLAKLARWTEFHVLCDRTETLEIDGRCLNVIGVDDRGRDWARGLSFDRKLADLIASAPGKTPIVLLAHRPDAFVQAAEAGVVLTLSGHTHGGQLAIPWFGGRYRNLAEIMTPFTRGLYERDGCHLYVNCGLGVTGQRVRVFTPREIAVIELGW
jgi:uncharacterized protein